jgi:UDP-N-acetylglucosamine 1-carboxyvinyltransferase
VDLHLKGLAALGASISSTGGYVEASATRLHGAHIVFDHVSVGATLHLMMAAALADGVTTLANAAREPEVVDLADLLNAMGGQVRGAGSDTVVIEGVKTLHGAEHDNIPDRIEAGTWLVASLLTGGRIEIEGARRDHLQAVEARLEQAGATLEERQGVIGLKTAGPWKAADVSTLPYPGFPTDMQAQWMTLMSLASGTTVIRETIFENRFQHVSELVRLGADISVQDRAAVVRGVRALTGAPVMVSDLRAGVSLVLAGLAAQGTTEIHRIYHLDRGYDRLVEKLRGVGARIERIAGPAI